MKTFLIVLLMFLCCNTVAAQRPIWLSGESADGKTLKLLWFLKTWETGLTGFDIKRRIGNGGWEKLSPTAIFPEISLKKSLQNVEPNEAQQSRLKAKLQNYIAQKHIWEIPASLMLKQLYAGKEMLQAITMTVAYDYDLALITGFGRVDRTAVAGSSYEYGLFFIKNDVAEDNAAATFTWKSGTAAMLDPKISITSQPVAKTKRVQLTWKLDTMQLKNTKIVGYNIYKRIGASWKKLTTSPVASSGNDKSLFTYFDNTSLSNQNVQYGLSAQSLFGNEGQKTVYTYNAAENPVNHQLPVLAEVASSADNFANGFNINWTFPKELEKLLKGFTVEKANLPGDFKIVSPLLQPSQRSFTDKSFTPPGGYARLRVNVLYKDDEQLSSNEKMIFYLPAIALAPPSNVTAKWLKENDRTFIDISWEPRAASDSLLQEYHFYVSNPFDTALYLQSSMPEIKENHLRYEIFNSKTTTYRLKIVPVSRYNTEGGASDLITVNAPATVLTIPGFDSYFVDTANRVTLRWNYNTSEVKGFRIFQDEKLIAGDDILKKDTQSYTTAPLKDDEKYVYTLQAVNEGGIESRLSLPLDVLIYKRGKN